MTSRSLGCALLFGLLVSGTRAGAQSETIPPCVLAGANEVLE